MVLTAPRCLSYSCTTSPDRVSHCRNTSVENLVHYWEWHIASSSFEMLLLAAFQMSIRQTYKYPISLYDLGWQTNRKIDK